MPTIHIPSCISRGDLCVLQAWTFMYNPTLGCVMMDRMGNTGQKQLGSAEELCVQMTSLLTCATDLYLVFLNTQPNGARQF